MPITKPMDGLRWPPSSDLDWAAATLRLDAQKRAWAVLVDGEATAAILCTLIYLTTREATRARREGDGAAVALAEELVEALTAALARLGHPK